MLKRRSFIQQTSIAALGALFLSNKALASLVSGPGQHAVGLQLYTLFNVIDDDVPGALQKVANIGFTEIESAFSKKGGYYGMKPKAFAEMLQSMGMSWQSHHVLGAPFKLPPGAKMPLDPSGKPIKLPAMLNLKDNMQQLVADAAEGGVKYLVCASTPITTLDDIKTSTEILNKTGELCKKSGIQFVYHNHDAEFHSVEGTVPYEYFLAQTNADMVKMELDLAWAIKGGKDPVALFNQHPGRFPLWHVKDLDATRENILPVGDGTIDFKRIFEQAKIAGMQHVFVEHDMPKDPYASITKSIAAVKKMV